MAVLALDALLTLRAEWHRQGRRLVLTNGVFDLLHSGHVGYLQQARTLGDILVVALNSDASTRALKGSLRPLVAQDDRAAVLTALACVDYVTIFEQPTAEHVVARLAPEIYVKGGDYGELSPAELARRLPEARVVASYGGRVELLPFAEGHSTTTLIERIIERYCR